MRDEDFEVFLEDFMDMLNGLEAAKTATANPSSFTQFSEEANLRKRKGE